MTPLGPWLLVLLCSPLWHTEGVNGWGVSPVPSESECRPHIEKALKEKELTLETQQEAVDAADSEHTAHPSPPAEQEGSIEETEEAITKESADESTSHEAHQQSDVVSAETAESKEDASIENQAVESSETPVEGESIESAETQESVPEETIGEEKKTEDSLETGSKEQTSIEDESQSVETDEKTEATSIEDTAAEQLSAETPDETTKEKTSLEEETKSEEVSLEQTKEEHEAASELSNEAVEDKKSEEASVEGPSAEKQSVEENLNETKEESTETKEETTEPKEEFTEKTNTSEDLTTSNEDQTVENSVESPGGEITDSLENADSLENKESTEPQESVETTTEEPKDSVEKSEEKPEASREDTKEAVSEEQNETKPAVEESLETTESDKTESSGTSKENLTESTTSTETVQDVTNLKIEATPTEGVKQENADEAQKESTEEAATEQDPAAAEEVVKEQEPTVEDQLTLEFEMPKVRRSREHIGEILRLTPESAETELLLAKTTEATLKELKKLYDVAIKPLEILYKYRDLSNRHFGDPEIFSKPLILFMGPWSGGKSTILNYLLDNEFKSSSLRTGAEPSPAYFNILMWGEREEVMDGTQLAADWTFSGLQKFGQGLLDRLRGLRLNAPLLEKVNIVEIPGILEIRKQVERLFPFNDACQWFIDRADIIFLVYDPSKLDVGPETEAILDQLKGREYQTRIILNKADQVKPEELMRVQGTLIWNISPLMSSQEPPVMYSTSLWSIPYEQGAPSRLLHAQERAFLRDMRQAIDKRVENKIASARRFAVRVRNHAKMVDCYLTTYYNHKTFFGNRKKVADDIVEHPQNYHIYEGLSTLTNISRYDLPDPEVYRDFFRLNALYDFQRLSDTCTYFRGCPINRLDVAIAYDLPELVGKWKKQAERVLDAATEKQGKS